MTEQNRKWSESPIHDQIKRAGLDNAGEAQALPSSSGSALVKIEEADELLMLLEDTIKGKDGDTITRIRGLLCDASLLLQNTENYESTT